MALTAALVLFSSARARAYDPRLDAEEPLEVVGSQPAVPAPIPEPAILRVDAQGPMLFDGPVGSGMDRALKPVYRAAERISDRTYDVLRSYVVRPALPGRLSRSLRAEPDGDSYQVFKARLRRNEARYAERLRESYPIAQIGQGGEVQDRLRAWRAWAQEEQQSVVVSAFGDALMQRYGIDRFGKASEKYAGQRRNWGDPGFFTMAAIVGGGLAYANGVHARAPMGPLRLYVDLRAAYLVQRAIQSGDPRARIGDVDLGYRGFPLRLTTAWGVDAGHVRDELVGLKGSMRF